jgi:hypothetical protein
LRGFKAEEYNKDYEYDKAKREERKKTRNTRERRRSGRGIWEAKPADE